MPPIDVVLGALEEFGGAPRQRSNGWTAKCPAHRDRKPSLSISVGEDGRVLLNCHAGCDAEHICSVLGLKMRDLFSIGPNGAASKLSHSRKSKAAPTPLDESKTVRNSKARRFAELQQAIADAKRRRGTPHHRWDYHDRDGRLVGVVLRWNTVDSETGKPGKDYLPISLEDGTWAQIGMPTLRPLYRLPALLAASQDATIWVGEGEKVADALHGLGLIATTSPHGSGSAKQADWSAVRGRDVIIACDRDAAGELYGTDVEDLARAAGARSVAVLKPWVLWPEIPEKGDVADVVASVTSPETVRTTLEDWARTSTADGVDDAFKLVSAAQLIGSHPELRPAVITSLLREGEVMNLVAAPKVGKTWMAHSLALSVASGRPWFGLTTTPGRVLLIDGELHGQTLSRRLIATVQALGLPSACLENVHVWCLRGKRKTVDDLARQLRNFPPGTYRLIVVDALYRFIPIGAEENSNESMTHIYNTLDAIGEHSRAAVSAVHHSTKGDQSSKAVTDVGAGGGAQSRAADAHLALRPHQEQGAVIVEAAVRSWPAFAPFVIKWQDPGWERDDSLDPTARARPGGGRKNAQNPPVKKEVSPSQFARAFVGSTPLLKDEVFARARAGGVSVARASSLLKLAEAEGSVFRLVSGFSTSPRFSTMPEGGGGTATAPTPGVSTPGGSGGGLHPPSPPGPRVPERRSKAGTSRSAPRA